MRAQQRLLASLNPDVVLAHHGIYMPQGIWVETTKALNIPVVTWLPSYRTDSFLLSHDDTYHHTMIDEPHNLWDQKVLSDSEERALTEYLEQRRSGTADWISFGSGQVDDFNNCLNELGLEAAKPTIVLLTSVAWDAQLHYESNAFVDQTAWLDATIDHFSRRPNVNLIVRVHPAEVTGHIPSNQRLGDHILAQNSPLPPNIAVVQPENPMNTYALTNGCNAALIYSSKMGVELAARGVQVIVAGEAWIRNKGFSKDASSPATYESFLKDIPFASPLTDEQRERARRYAWHFFFRRMVQLPGFEIRENWPPYRSAVHCLSELQKDTNPNLDMVCNNILNGQPFIALE